MTYLTKTLFLACFVSLTLFTACNDDEGDNGCVAPDVAENIIGSWGVSLTGQTVSFNADGTLEDPTDVLIGGELNGQVLTQKTYEATNDTLYLRATSPISSSDFLSAPFPIEKNECDAITINLLGINLKLNRQ